MNSRHRKTLEAVFDVPTRVSIPFADIEALFVAIGAQVREREGSRVCFVLADGRQWRCHRPHPGKDARRYQVEEARELLIDAGIRP